MKLFAIATAAVTALLFQRATSLTPPARLDRITCAYVNCLDKLIDSYDRAPPFPEELEEQLDLALNKMKKARNKMEKDGNVVVSVDRVKQGLKFMERVIAGSGRLPDSIQIDFAYRTSRTASTCLIDLVTEYTTSGQGLIDDDGLLLEKLDLAREANNVYEWRKSARYALQGIRIITDEYGSKNMPLCPA